jgi:hypothetical protein
LLLAESPVLTELQPEADFAPDLVVVCLPAQLGLDEVLAQPRLLPDRLQPIAAPVQAEHLKIGVLIWSDLINRKFTDFEQQ